MTMRPAQVVVLAKVPTPGQVKTRLTPPYSPEQAADLALAALLDTLRAASAAAVHRCVLVLDGEPGGWLPPGVVVRPQRGGPLDERIAHALVDAFSELPLPVLLIGMDTPQVTAADLDRAVEQLLAPAFDAVLGPADDGGYWALGLRRPRVEHVLGVAMSLPDTKDRQLSVLRAAGLRVAGLDVMRDVDDARDASQVALLAPQSSFAAALARLAVGIA